MATVSRTAETADAHLVLRRELTYLWFVFAVVSINVHLHLGLVGYHEAFTTSASMDPAAVLHVATAIGLFFVVLGIYLHSWPTRELYLVGMVFSALLVLAYADWHALGIVSPLVVDHSVPSGAPAELLVDHLMANPLVMAATVAEVGLVVVFGLLYALE